MKKALLLMALLLLSVAAFSQQAEELRFTQSSKSEVYNSSLSKDELFKNARKWLANRLVDYKSSIAYEDQEAGQLFIIGYFDEFTVRSYYEEHAPTHKIYLSVEVKDRKFRLQIKKIGLSKSYSMSYISELVEAIVKGINTSDSW